MLMICYSSGMNFQWSWIPTGKLKNRIVAISFLFVSALIGALYFVLEADAVSKLALLGLGGVFFLIGITVLILDLRGSSPEHVNNIGGMLGALSFALPAMIQFPFVYKTDFWIGLLFFALGLVTLIGSIALYRYQERTGNSSWSASWSTDSKDENV